MMQNRKLVATRQSAWNSMSVQLSVGMIFAVLIPYIIRLTVSAGSDLDSLYNSLLGTIVALAAGHYGFSRLANYPGVRASYHILPSFAIAYGSVLAVFFFLRLDYSRLHFISSFLLCACWYYIVYFKRRRQRQLRFGVLPFGSVDNLVRIDDIDWVMLHDPGAIPMHLDGIVADLRADIPDDWERFLTDKALEGTLVMHVKQIEESLTGRVAIEHLSENNLGSLLPGIVFDKVKRAGDLAASILLLPVLLPVLLLVALLVRLDSPGPALFRQERMGYRGKSFRMFKFRTMTHVSAPPEGDGREAAMTRDQDKRVTRLGKYLRRYRIDELPQVVNILRGEMSWIGPRPEAVALSLWYEAELPFYRYRHIVRPGITGWAQVKQGHVAEVDEVLGKLHYDFYYIRNFSIWLDILIIAGTARTVLNGFGAR